MICHGFSLVITIIAFLAVPAPVKAILLEEDSIQEDDSLHMLQHRVVFHTKVPEQAFAKDSDKNNKKDGTAEQIVTDSGSFNPEAFSYVKVDEHAPSSDKRSSNAKVTPVLVVKLSHAGSSWFTAMMQMAPELYLQREGITNVDWAYDAPLTELVKYTNEALSRPRAQYKEQNATKVHDWEYVNYPNATKQCLDHFDDCRMPVTGFTLEMTDDIADNYQTFFQKVTAVHPDLKVVIYRRSNVVKRAMGQGGSNSEQTPVYEPLKNLVVKGHGYRRPELRSCTDIESVTVNELLQRVSIAVRQDQDLLRVKTLFPEAVVVNYEELQTDVAPPVDKTLRYLGIPYRVKVMKTTEEQPGKHSEDLSKYFDTARWQSFRSALQKWYPSTLPMLESKVEGELFDPPTEGNCTPDCLS